MASFALQSGDREPRDSTAAKGPSTAWGRLVETWSNSVMYFDLDNDGMEPSKRRSVSKSPNFILKRKANKEKTSVSYRKVRQKDEMIGNAGISWKKSVIYELKICETLVSITSIGVKLPTWKYYEADVSSIGFSSERVEGLWVVRGLYRVWRSDAIGGKLVVWRHE